VEFSKEEIADVCVRREMTDPRRVTANGNFNRPNVPDVEYRQLLG
jgi:hypothetical protein